ncbi:hypothetical protein Trydic_g1631 [Trypoxylus dichotomus]
MARSLYASLCLYLAVMTRPVSSSKNYYWREYIPGYKYKDAFEAAPSRYVGQFPHCAGDLVATIYPFSNMAVGIQDTRIIQHHHIKILCSTTPEKFYWQKVSFKGKEEDQMKHGVKGGYQAEIKHWLFIGRIFDDDEWKIGKVIPMNQKDSGLIVWDRDTGIKRFEVFEMLKRK